MFTVDFGHGLRLKALPGESVLQLSLNEGVEIAHACGGHGECTTCRLLVEEGIEHCPPPSDAESQALEINGLETPTRLACMLKPSGDVRVRILIPTHDQPGRERPEAAVEDVAVMFVDLRGFTSFAETRLPFDVCNVLNRYYDTMGILIERHNGRILNYLGDGMMTLFRPAQSGDAPQRAVTCALEMRGTAHTFGGYVRDHFNADLGIGIAVHCGRAVVGKLGFFRHREFNAVGDVLNVTARLEDFNKECDTDILITEPVAKSCDEIVEIGRSFELKLRGRSERVKALEVLGRKRHA